MKQSDWSRKDEAVRLEQPGWSSQTGAARLEESDWSSQDGAVRLEQPRWSSQTGAARMEQSDWRSQDGAVRLEQPEWSRVDPRITILYRLGLLMELIPEQLSVLFILLYNNYDYKIKYKVIHNTLCIYVIFG